MITNLISLLGEYVDLEPDAKSFLEQNIPIEYYRKGDILLEEGEVADCMFVILQGCVRTYFRKDGVQNTISLRKENEFCISWESYITQTPSRFVIDCIEHCVIGRFAYDVEQEAYTRFPKIQEFSRVFKEFRLAKNQELIANFVSMSPKDRYLNFIHNHHDLSQRVPQYIQASYLGISPESLSRIRRRLGQEGYRAPESSK
ncbi:MAG: Crp/Fnr family transcriptional regulator [Bacteroidia bacterium]|nr:Crp/Fnr family transcriptional regulator [Bacteroidia bacterium]